MFTRILVGIDGETGGQDALALARTLASPSTELALAHVWQRFDGVVAAALGGPHPVEAGKELLERTWRELDRPGRTLNRKAGSVAEGLHRAAEDEQADLLVVGSPAAQRTGHVRMGDDTRASLHGAPCAVAVAPRGFAAEHRGADLRRIGVAWQDTPEAGEALRVARGIAGEHGAELHVTSVLSRLPSAWEGAYAYVEVFDDITGDDEREAKERLAALGADVIGHVAWGWPVDELLSTSDTLDLLVLGSRGYGPVRRLLLGSTSDGVTKEAACAVLVVPRGSHAPSEPTSAAAGARA